MVDVIGVDGRRTVEAAERLPSERRRELSRGALRHSFGLRGMESHAHKNSPLSSTKVQASMHTTPVPTL